jgi:DedD protein
MAETPDLNVDELRRRARRRLIGAIVLALGAAVVVPMLLESDPKPLGDDVAVKIPPEDNARFVNRLNDKGAKTDTALPPAKSEPAKEAAKAERSKAEPPKAEPPKAESTTPATPQSETAMPQAPQPESAPAAPPESAPTPTNVPPPRKSISQAEQKMLGATAKPAAPLAATPPPTAAAQRPAAVAPPSAGSVAPAPAEAPKDGYSVQLAAFADDRGANSLANRLKKAAYPAYTEPLTTSRGTLWRVRVGPYPSREVAVEVRDKLKGEGFSGIVAAPK